MRIEMEHWSIEVPASWTVVAGVPVRLFLDARRTDREGSCAIESNQVGVDLFEVAGPPNADQIRRFGDPTCSTGVIDGRPSVICDWSNGAQYIRSILVAIPTGTLQIHRTRPLLDAVRVDEADAVIASIAWR
ncbi:MAG: hypothetical protein ABI867_09465 [Kofleriaceae bacterium]